MDVVLPIIYSLVTLVLGGLGKFYFNSVNSKIKANSDMIKTLKEENANLSKELELNKQADLHFRENVTNGMKELKGGQESIVQKFDSFLEKFGYALEKLARGEV